MTTSQTTTTIQKEIRFNIGDSIGDLAMRVREAYDKGSREIHIACEDYTFPDHVVQDGIWDSPIGPVQWNTLLTRALTEISKMPQGTLTTAQNPTYQIMQPYSMSLVYSAKK